VFISINKQQLFGGDRLLILPGNIIVHITLQTRKHFVRGVIQIFTENPLPEGHPFPVSWQLDALWTSVKRCHRRCYTPNPHFL